MPKRKLPSHIPGTSRDWKQLKRREWKAVLKAFEIFRGGCAYTPAYDCRLDGLQAGSGTTPRDYERFPLTRLEAVMKDITQALSFESWGR